MELKYKSYNELPLRVFNEILNINTTDEAQFQIELLSILADVNENDILNLSLTEYHKLKKQATFITGFPSDNSYAPDKLTINQHKYTVCKNFKQITAAQYIDYQSYLKMKDKKYEFLLSCFIIPEGKQYGEGYNIDDVIKDILELDVTTVVNICFFFLNYYLTSIDSILHYWELRMKKMIRKEKNLEMKQKMQEIINQIHLMKNGVG